MQGMPAYCVRAFAEALEVVPYTLAENAGLSPIAVCTLRCKLPWAHGLCSDATAHSASQLPDPAVASAELLPSHCLHAASMCAACEWRT